jgi:hypothetical protein
MIKLIIDVGAFWSGERFWGEKKAIVDIFTTKEGCCQKILNERNSEDRKRRGNGKKKVLPQTGIGRSKSLGFGHRFKIRW